MPEKTLSAVAIIATLCVTLGLLSSCGDSEDASADKLAKEEFETILHRGPWNVTRTSSGVEFRVCKALVEYWDDRPLKKQIVVFVHNAAHRQIYQMKYDDLYNFLNGGGVDMAVSDD